MKLDDEIMNYGFNNLDTSVLDGIYIRNKIDHILGIYNNDPIEVGDKFEFENMSAHDLYEDIRKFLSEKIDDENETNLIIDQIFGELMPLPSEISRKFYSFKKSDDGMSYLRRLSENSNYINLFNIKKNFKWTKKLENNEIQLTINLSKPEKSNKDIAKAAKEKVSDSDSPKCVLCAENEGFYGNSKKAPRSTLRMIPFSFSPTDLWYIQFSPYVYFENHIILLNSKHVPMTIGTKTIERFIKFVDSFPSYFVGSNADLPIVGGSILSHEHYQGGTHELPIFKAKNKLRLHDEKVAGEIYWLDWYNSTIKVVTENPAELVYFSEKVMEIWKKYEDKNLNIIPESDGVRHNTITPILRKKNKKYELYMILRNNYCNEEYPDGVFHVHPEYYNIKKEGIGLIEAQGLFILPGRLYGEVELIEKYFEGKPNLDEYIKDHPELEVHHDMIKRIEENYNAEESAKIQILREISNEGVGILKNTAVFKEDQEEELSKFFKKCKLDIIKMEKEKHGTKKKGFRRTR